MLGHLDTLSHPEGVGHHGDIAALMHHNGFADGKQEIFIPVVGHIKLHAVVLAVLHHNHGIIVPDGGFQQALGGIGIGRDDDLGAGEVGDDRVQILGVLGGGGRPAPMVVRMTIGTFFCPPDM